MIQKTMNKLPEKGLLIVSKIVWFVCTARNAIVVIICALMAGYMEKGTFVLTGEINGRIPKAQFPAFSIPANVSNSNEEVPFTGMVKQLGSGIIIIPLIAILESVAIAKAFCM